jgi:FkbM family methyltransferase
MQEVLVHVRRQGFRPRTVIDVGVGDGTSELYATNPEATFLLVEPLREFEPRLQQISKDYDARYVIAAAGEREGSVTLNVHPDLLSSSTLRETEGRHVDGIPREVPSVTVDALCERMGLGGPYLLKADVQGAELSVLEGAKTVLAACELVLLEVSLFRFFEGGPELSDVVAYMRERGFVVYDIFGGHLRPLDGALAQVDLAFVKETGQFRRAHAYATPEQREARTRGAREP